MKHLRLIAVLLILLVATMLPASAAMKPHKPMLMMSGMTIYDVAAKQKDLSIFVKCVRAAGLESGMKKPGAWTVFAPSNAAFMKLPKATVNMLMMPANKMKLQKLLEYHAIAGKVTAGQAMMMKKPAMKTTLEGASIMVSAKKNMVMVNNARVIKADMMASNGVIHMIDTVLMPPMKSKMMPMKPMKPTMKPMKPKPKSGY